MTDLTAPIFTDEEAARKHFEAIRWPNGPVCPKCGTVDQATLVKGKSHRKGMYQCNACREPFTVTVGSVMESSHVPLHKWALGFHLMAASKKGISAHQLMRNLGLGSYRTAWFMAHRIREAMRDDAPGPMGGEGKTVEIDKTFVGRQKGVPVRTAVGHKHAVLTLVERGGSARSFHVDGVGVADLQSFIDGSVSRVTAIMTDENSAYRSIGKAFASHDTAVHSKGEYAGGPITTNAVESYSGVFKRGMRGVYQHCGERHCIATWSSSTSGIPIVPSSDTTIRRAPRSRCRVPLASGSPTGNLVPRKRNERTIAKLRLWLALIERALSERLQIFLSASCWVMAACLALCEWHYPAA